MTMTTAAAPSTFRLILVPSIVTLLVSVLRFVGETKGWFPVAAGGSATWLGITWFGLAFALWFAHRLRRAGSAPRGSRTWLCSVVSLLPLVAVAAWRVPNVLAMEGDEAGLDYLRATAIMFAVAGCFAAVVAFVVWPRLAWTLLVYAIPARLTVVVLTWIDKDQDLKLHYTKFGPKGFERDMEGTIVSASIMQLGFWVPFTIFAGTLLGVVFFGRSGARQQAAVAA